MTIKFRLLRKIYLNVLFINLLIILLKLKKTAENGFSLDNEIKGFNLQNN